MAGPGISGQDAFDAFNREELAEARRRIRKLGSLFGHLHCDSTFLEDRTQRNRFRLQLVAYLGIAMLILAVELYLLRDRAGGLPTAEWVAVLPAWLLAILALATALLTGSPRILVYAVILVASGVFGAVASWSPATILMTVGSVMLTIAAALLTRFLIRHPMHGEPET